MRTQRHRRVFSTEREYRQMNVGLMERLIEKVGKEEAVSFLDSLDEQPEWKKYLSIQEKLEEK